ncbi:MAG: hypothetical protein IPJ00_07395 [Saprospirales bacterium]|nr:hypothetical protein [Saprospirales bacterium]
MDDNEKIYDRLKKQYSDQEIADAHVISEELTDAEKAAAGEEMRQIRLEKIKTRTEEQRLQADLTRLRILMRTYTDKESYSVGNSFGAFLGEYIRIIRKSKKAFSIDIGLHYTTLSRILHDRESPNIELMYRLEAHSAGLLPAILWWELLIKKQGFEIRQDTDGRKEEAKRVKNALTFRS